MSGVYGRLRRRGLQQAAPAADTTRMTLAHLAYAACAVVALFGVGAALFTLANKLAWEMELHDLKADARALRAAYERRLAAMRSGELVEMDHQEVNVDIVEPDAA